MIGGGINMACISHLERATKSFAPECPTIEGALTKVGRI